MRIIPLSFRRRFLCALRPSGISQPDSDDQNADKRGFPRTRFAQKMHATDPDWAAHRIAVLIFSREVLRKYQWDQYVLETFQQSYFIEDAPNHNPQ